MSHRNNTGTCVGCLKIFAERYLTVDQLCPNCHDVDMTKPGITPIQVVAIRSISELLNMDYIVLAEKALEMPPHKIPTMHSLSYEEALAIVLYANKKCRENNKTGKK